MKKLLSAIVLASISCSSLAVEYRARGNPDIVQMHLESTWEKVCETFNNDCDVPEGTYMVTSLDRNWNQVDRQLGIVVSGGSTPAAAVSPAPSVSSAQAAIIQYHDTQSWAKVCQARLPLASGDCTLPAGTYQVTTFDSQWNQLDLRTETISVAAATPVREPEPTPEPTPAAAPAPAAAPTPPPVAITKPDNAIFVADYERGGLDSNVAGLEALPPPAENSIRLAGWVSRSGNRSVNHRVGFSPEYKSAGAWRAESNSIDMRPSRYDQGETIRYQFSIYLPPSWKIDSTQSIDIIWQWKRFSSRPDLFALIRGGNIELRGPDGWRSTVMANYRVGEWIDLQFDVLHSASGDGYVKTYYKYANQRNYTLSGEYRGRTMLASGPTDSTYLKWGLYKPDFDQSDYPNTIRSIFHDDIRVLKLP